MLHQQCPNPILERRERHHRDRSYLGGDTDATAFTTVAHEIANRFAIRFFGTASAATLRIKEQTSPRRAEMTKHATITCRFCGGRQSWRQLPDRSFRARESTAVAIIGEGPIAR